MPIAVAASDSSIRALADAWARYPVHWEAKLSPDGKWLAWSWSGIGDACDVYVAPTDGSAAPLRLTQGKDHAFVRGWSPDSRSILVGRDKGGDEREQLLLVDPSRPFDLKPLTEETPDFFLYGGALHPNGKWLFFCAQFDPHDAEGRTGACIYRHDMDTGERRMLARMLQGEGTGPLLSPDGQLLLYHRRDKHPAGSQVWLVDVEGKENRPFLDFGDNISTRAQWLGADGKVLVHSVTATHDRVGVVDIAGGEVVWLLDDPRYQIESLLPSDDGKSIMVIEGREGRVRAMLLPLVGGPGVPIETGDDDLLPIAALPGGDWIAIEERTDQPTEFVRFDPRNPAQRISLSRTRERVPPLAASPAQAESIRWRSVDGMEIQGWLYRPRGKSRGLVVWVHGGPTFHSGNEIDSLAQCLVANGFAVLDPNYRGSTGFGLPFREAIKGDGWGGREQEDIRTGIEHLISTGLAQRGRIGIAGLSYGGFSSWHAVTKYPDLIAAAAPICGMTDLAIDYEETHLPHGRLYSEEMMGGKPAQQAQRYFECSPINHIGNIRGRLLIVHGLRDPNVSPRNTEVACDALAKAGIPFELLTFENEGHGIWRPANRRILLERLLRLFGAAFAAA
jgi:dipeptidyl aminopeptidase/acylaminoacyl peptidase